MEKNGHRPLWVLFWIYESMVLLLFFIVWLSPYDPGHAFPVPLRLILFNAYASIGYIFSFGIFDFCVWCGNALEADLSNYFLWASLKLLPFYLLSGIILACIYSLFRELAFTKRRLALGGGLLILSIVFDVLWFVDFVSSGFPSLILGLLVIVFPALTVIFLWTQIENSRKGLSKSSYQFTSADCTSHPSG